MELGSCYTNQTFLFHVLGITPKFRAKVWAAENFHQPLLPVACPDRSKAAMFGVILT